MKRSTSNAELSSDEEEPLDAAGDAAMPTQDLKHKPQRVQVLGNNGEGSIQGARGVVLESTEAGLGLESCPFQDVSRDAIQDNREVAAQPTDAGLVLEFHNFQEQPNVEELDIEAISDVAIQLMQAGPGLELLNFEEQPNVEEGSTHPICGAVVQPMQAGLGLESQNFQEQPNIEERGGIGLQPTQVALPSPLNQGNDALQALTDGQIRLIVELAHFFSCNVNNPRNVQAGTPHPEGETGSEGSVLQTLPSDMDDVETGQDETSHQEEEEEEASIHDIIGLQPPPIDMDNLRRVGWIELADLDEPMDAEEGIVIQALPGEQEMQGLDEPGNDEADSSIQVQVGQPIQMRECMVNTDEVLSIYDIHDIFWDLTEEERHSQFEEFVQAFFPGPDTNNLRNVQAGASHPEKETGNNDGSVLQTSPCEMNEFRNGQGETSHQEEEASPVSLIDLLDAKQLGIVIRALAGELDLQVDEPMDDEADRGIQVQVGQPKQMRECMFNTVEELSIYDIFDIFCDLTEEERHAQFEEFVQALFRRRDTMSNLRNVQAGAAHPEEETGNNDGSAPQTSPSEMNDLRNGQGETSHQEEEASPVALIDLPDAKELDIIMRALAGEQEMQGLDEPMDDEADRGIQVQVGQPIQMRECMVNTDEVLSIHDICDIFRDFPEEERHAQFEEFVQAVFRQRDTNNLRNVQAGASHSSEMNDLRNGQGETSLQEKEEAGLNDKIGPQASPVNRNKPMDDDEDIVIQARAGQQQVQGVDEPVDDEEDTGIEIRAGQLQMQDAPPQQGTAGRRMLLQVPLCGAEGPIEQSVFRLPQVRELACLVECI